MHEHSTNDIRDPKLSKSTPYAPHAAHKEPIDWYQSQALHSCAPEKTLNTSLIKHSYPADRSDITSSVSRKENALEAISLRLPPESRGPLPRPVFSIHTRGAHIVFPFCVLLQFKNNIRTVPEVKRGWETFIKGRWASTTAGADSVLC